MQPISYVSLDRNAVTATEGYLDIAGVEMDLNLGMSINHVLELGQ